MCGARVGTFLAKGKWTHHAHSRCACTQQVPEEGQILPFLPPHPAFFPGGLYFLWPSGPQHGLLAASSLTRADGNRCPLSHQALPPSQMSVLQLRATLPSPTSRVAPGDMEEGIGKLFAKLSSAIPFLSPATPPRLPGRQACWLLFHLELLESYCLLSASSPSPSSPERQEE